MRMQFLRMMTNCAAKYPRWHCTWYVKNDFGMRNSSLSDGAGTDN